MKTKILIVEDQFIEANNLRIILLKAGYQVCSLARSVMEATAIIAVEKPEMVFLDIFLQGRETGIDLAKKLQAQNIAFVYLSANSNKETLDAAKATNPYGFLVKPFRERDVLIMLDIALYRHHEDMKRDIDLQEVAPAVKANQQAFKHIIGSSKGLAKVLEQAKIVAPSDTSVLILGESGTGKELIAQCIHQLSGRSTKPLVVVNCATLPENLIESELFGHEKGSCTGASDKRIGKFELANGGTVFLDEIGELPLSLQVKFLRVLQEREIEPIGGKSRPINVRIIAATNRNLEQEIEHGHFRLDLYYRLNVFPIMVPALRDRTADIGLLANHFIKHCAAKLNKKVIGLADGALKSMLEYPWPGNIRELENVIERSVLLTNGQLINQVALPSVKAKTNISFNTNTDIADNRVKTMTENERDHILAVLNKCDWKLHGPGGAAGILKINPSTLHSRMKKLGIERKLGYKEI
jgi:two-component system response regulator HydG